MKMSRFARVAGFIAASLPVGAHAAAADKEPVVLAPVNSWQLEMAENKCRIARVFGTRDQPTLFYLEQWNPSSSASWTVAGEPFARFGAHRETMYSFGPVGDSGTIDFTPSTLGDFGDAIQGTSGVTTASRNYEDDEATGEEGPRGLPRLELSGADQIATFTVSQRGRGEVVLELGKMDAVLKAMNGCMDDLVEHWGYDVAEQRSVVTPPRISNMRRVVSRVMDTYPKAALRKGAQADFHLRLAVGKTGSVDDCKLINQTLADTFDMRLHPCAAFTDLAQVEPARDGNGEPVATYYVARIIYRMGG